MIDDLEKAEGFVPGSAAALDDSEWWLSRVREDGLSGGPRRRGLRGLSLARGRTRGRGGAGQR